MQHWGTHPHTRTTCTVEPWTICILAVSLQPEPWAVWTQAEVTQGIGAVTVESLSHVWFFCYPVDCSPPGSAVHWTSQAKHWRGLLFPNPGNLSHSGAKLKPASPSWQADSLPRSNMGSQYRGTGRHQGLRIRALLENTGDQSKRKKCLDFAWVQVPPDSPTNAHYISWLVIELWLFTGPWVIDGVALPGTECFPLILASFWPPLLISMISNHPPPPPNISLSYSEIISESP